MKNKYNTFALIIFDIIYYIIVKYSDFLIKNGFDAHFWLFGNNSINLYENVITTATPIYIILGIILLLRYPRLGFSFLCFIPINAILMLIHAILHL